MSVTRLLTQAYHALIPLALRRHLRLTRFTASRRARTRVWRQTGGRVAGGPFAGMQLRAATPDDCEGPVLLGSFECETHDWLERELARGWRIAVNIGSAGGYYSTGLAMRLNDAAVFAFEMDPAWRDETGRSAAVNGVAERVRCLGTATVDELAALPIPPAQGALVVCDCEGAERELLDPARVAWLTRSALCVELHDFAAPGATDTLIQRFATTHELVMVEQRPRDAAAWAACTRTRVEDAQQLCDEGRSWGEMHYAGRWLLATPRV